MFYNSFFGMNWLQQTDKKSIKPVYQQIKESILSAVLNNKLKTGDSLPSVNKICSEFSLAPGTVIRAYNELKEMGIISSKQGKGYFISGTYIEQKIRIFLLFDRMNAFKEILYDSFRNEFNDETDIQVFFHHYNLKRFEKLIRENLGKFSHYVLMPHLHENVHKIIQRIPVKKLIFIDNLPDNIKTTASAVYQNFYSDILNALETKLDLIKKYKAIHLSLSQSEFQFVPKGTLDGFESFCRTNNVEHKILGSITADNLKKNQLYIIFDDGELVNTLKMIQKKNWKFKSDIGIISFDETPMKELLAGGVSVLSTDFVQMGKTAAKMVKGELDTKVTNPFRLIYRNSF